MIIADVFLNYKERIVGLKIPLAYLGVLALIVAVFVYGKASIGIDGWLLGTIKGYFINSIFVASVFGILILGIASGRNVITHILDTPLVTFLGKSSYAFYLIHINVFRHFYFTGNYYLNIFIDFVLLFIIAGAIYVLFEAPVYKFILAKFKK